MFREIAEGVDCGQEVEVMNVRPHGGESEEERMERMEVAAGFVSDSVERAVEGIVDASAFADFHIEPNGDLKMGVRVKKGDWESLPARPAWKFQPPETP